MKEQLLWILQGIFITLFMEAWALILMAWRANEEKRKEREEFEEMIASVQEKLHNKENGGMQE